MITEWAVTSEPVIAPTFAPPFAAQYFFASDIEFLSALGGVVFLAPNQSFLYRMFVDSDGAVATESAGQLGALPSTTPYTGIPQPVKGQVSGDLLIYSAASGIIFPMGLVSEGNAMNFARLRVDDDGSLVTESVTLGDWILIPETNIPVAVDVSGNWLYIQDLVCSTPGAGLVMPCRGSIGNSRRIRLDIDGAILAE